MTLEDLLIQLAQEEAAIEMRRAGGDWHVLVQHAEAGYQSAYYQRTMTGVKRQLSGALSVIRQTKAKAMDKEEA